LRDALGIEIEVMGDEQIEMAVAVVIDERTTRSPSTLPVEESCVLGDIAEGPVAIIVIQDILSPVRDENVVKAVVIVIGNAD